MTYISDRNALAIEAIAEWITNQYPAATAADKKQLAKHGLGSEYTGWLIPIPSGGRLIFAVDSGFPYSLPKTALSERPDQKLAPHVEGLQVLCTWGPAADFSTDEPVEVARAYIEASFALIEDNEAGGDVDDFSVDFEAYWGRDATSAFKIYSLAELRPPSRPLAAWYGTQFLLVAETEERCRQWLVHRYGKVADKGFWPAAFVWMDTLPSPAEYPNDALALRKMVKSKAPDAAPIVDATIASVGGRRVVVVAGPSNSIRASGGGIIVEPPIKNTLVEQPIYAGFRRGRVPPHIQAARTKLTRTRLQQVEATSTRLEAGTFEALKRRRVAIVGCGSLGAGVARLLAQTGVGKFLLFDPEVLQWENIGRHELGAADVDKGKATQLAAHLRSRLPHLAECKPFDKSWLSVASNDEALFDGCDLVISTMGKWIAECGLSDFIRSRPAPIPLMFGWLERKAMAAHALAVGAESPCFRCGFDPLGAPLLPATSWLSVDDNEQCGANASPYGATQLGVAQSLISDLAIDLLLDHASAPAHRVWLGQTADLERQDGYWSTKWVESVGDPGRGGIMLGAPWPQRAECGCV